MTKITVIRDRREKAGYGWYFKEYPGIKLVEKTLKKGDYSIEGLENVFRIERKHDAKEVFGWLGSKVNAKRAANTIAELSQIKHSFLIIESSLEEILQGTPFSGVDPNWILSRLMSFAVQGVHIIFAGKDAEKVAVMLIRKIAKLYE